MITMWGSDNDMRRPGEEASDNDERWPDEEGSVNDATGFDKEGSIEGDAFKDNALFPRKMPSHVSVRLIFCEGRTSPPTARRKAACFSQGSLMRPFCSNVKDEGDFG